MFCLLLLLAPALSPLSEDRDGIPGAQASWESALSWLRGEQERMEADLERAHSVLRERAAAEDPTLLAQIDPEPPRALPTGYGLLPTIREDQASPAREPRKRTYSLAELPGLFARDLLDAARLADRASVEPLADGVAELERLRGRLRRLDEHLTYHAWWQVAIVDDAEYFAERNEVLALVRSWREVAKQGADATREAELARQVRERVAPFRRTAGLRIERDEAGVATLLLRVHTDVDDRDFLQAVERAVRTHWNDSKAFRATRLVLALEWIPVDATELYPEGPPTIGAAIDVEEHMARFAEGAIVLTTGAQSTHARQGRYLQLGSQPLTPRTLAHEVGHLLGFSDAYLRAYEGDPSGKYGALIVEWHGLVPDLMGDTRGGSVGDEMVQELLRHYAD